MGLRLRGRHCAAAVPTRRQRPSRRYTVALALDSSSHAVMKQVRECTRRGDGRVHYMVPSLNSVRYS